VLNAPTRLAIIIGITAVEKTAVSLVTLRNRQFRRKVNGDEKFKAEVLNRLHDILYARSFADHYVINDLVCGGDGISIGNLLNHAAIGGTGE